jgi:Carboxypeptidase regulatory-like domain/TonB dependent receptor
MLRRICRTLSFLAILSLSIIASAQTAQFSGRVTDPVQAVVADAEVRIVNQATSVELKARTNGDGLYTIPFVQPGTYQIFVKVQGFSTVASQPVTITVGQAFVYDVQLKVGNTEEQVTVNATDIGINTTDASVSTVIDRQFVENLPLNGRSFQSLLFVTPGVTPNAGAAASGSEGTMGQFVVNGQRADANYWMVDGVSANLGMSATAPGTGAAGSVGAFNAVGGTSAMVSVDALEEFRIETSTYSPEFGRTPGGQISIQTRSGTNQFHGLLFEYLRNTVLDATDWFANHYGLEKAAEIQNDFGGVVGGPIHKDKTFFFFSYEGLRVLQPYTQVATVPDLAIREGAVPAMKPYMNMYPLPTPGAPDTSPGSGIAPYTATFSNPNKVDAFSLRMDHQLAKNLNLFARYNHVPSSGSARGGGTAANEIRTTARVTKTATVGATWTESAQLVNDTRFNYSVSGGKVHALTDSFGGGMPMPPSYFPSPYDYTNAILYMIPVFGTSLEEDTGLGGANFQRQYNLVDTLSLQKGKHSLKFGVDYRRLMPNYGQATYEGIPLFCDITDMAAGNSCLLINSHYAGGRFLFQNLGVFAQDSWRVNSRLNLTYGLRWDVDYAPQTTEGIPLPGVSGFSLTDLSQLLQVPGKRAYSTHFGNFAPRVGGAYRLVTTPGRELVLRSGFGVFYGLSSQEIVNTYAIREPIYPYGSNAFYSNATFPLLPTDPEAQLQPVVAPNAENGGIMYGVDPNINLPYALEWNVALERALGRAQSVSLSYIGASDKRQQAAESVSNPNPNYASVYLVGQTGVLNYQAMQVQFERRLTDGLQALVSYGWSHSIDTGSYGGYSNGSLANANANRGDSDYDLRNVFSAAVTYQPPAWKSNSFTRAITSDWSTNNVVQVRSGPPIDVTDGNFAAVTGMAASIIVRPDIVPGQPKYLSGSQYPGGKAMNPAAFTDPPVDPDTGQPTRQGNLGRNAFRALGLTQWDFSAQRDFPIHERLKLQFRAELYNILNHPNFAPFNSSFQTGNIYFGQSTQMLSQFGGGLTGSGQQSSLYLPGGPRSGEFALKLIF